MDKMYVCGRVKLIKFEWSGIDVLVEGEEEGKQIMDIGFVKL